MSQLRVECFAVSLDGYGAGPRQSLDDPLGVGGEALHDWRGMGAGGPAGGADAAFIERGFANVGAWILGRNMFGPLRGPWPDDAWKGWWGDDPPYHCDVFVLTAHARAPIEMKGGTTFFFVTDGIEAALARAKTAARGADVRLGGGVATVRQYLRAGLIDHMHLAIAPVLLGSGESLLAGIDLAASGWRVVEHLPGAKATHVVLKKGAA